jgi:sugar phosphate isomerase/epimerase
VELRAILDKVTYHAVYDASILDALAYARARGFAGVQVAVEAPHLSFEDLSDDEVGRIADLRAAGDMLISLHAPDVLASLLPPSRLLAEGIFAYFRALLDFAERIGAHAVTLHVGGETAFPTDTQPARNVPAADRALYRRILGRSLRRLVELNAGRVALCVESLHLTGGVRDAIQPLLAAGHLFLCWDVAKTFSARRRGETGMEEFFRRNVAHVRQVHLHDVRAGRGHRVIGTGEVPFGEVLPALVAAGGVREWCIEVRPREQALESLVNLRAMVAG